MPGLWWCTDKYVIPGMKNELLAAPARAPARPHRQVGCRKGRHQQQGRRRPASRPHPGPSADGYRDAGLSLSRGGPVTAPGLREIVSYPPGLSTMRNGAGRLRNVVPAHGPARRLTFRTRAGEDVARSRLPSPLEFYKTPDMPMARTWRADTTPEHLLVRVLRPGANLICGSRTESQQPWPE
jgi:hypothetical protein